MPKHGKARKTFAIYTQDRLLLNYHGAIGVKTGWTTKARGTFIGAATRNGHTLVATVLHTGFSSWEESRALLAWGFANFEKARPVGSLNQVKQKTQASPVRQNAAVQKATRCPPPPGAPVAALVGLGADRACCSRSSRCARAYSCASERSDGDTRRYRAYVGTRANRSGRRSTLDRPASSTAGCRRRGAVAAHAATNISS